MNRVSTSLTILCIITSMLGMVNSAFSMQKTHQNNPSGVVLAHKASAGTAKTMSLVAERQRQIERWQKTAKTVAAMCDHFKIQPIALQASDEATVAADSSNFYDKKIDAILPMIVLNPKKFYTYSPKVQIFLLGHEVAHIYKKHIQQDLVYEAEEYEIQEKIADARKKSDSETVKKLRLELTLLKIKFFQKSRIDEFEADYISATELSSKDAAIECMDTFIKEYAAKKASTFLGNGCELFTTHPPLLERRQHLEALPEKLFVQNKDNFNNTQQALIARLYLDLHDKVHTVNLTFEEYAVFKTLPKKIRQQIFKDFGCTKHTKVRAKLEADNLENNEERKTTVS